MGTATVITSNALTDLEDDVTELTTKLNGVITQYNLVQADMTTNKTAIDSLKTQFNLAESDLTNHKGKIDTLIIDMTAVNTKITGSYSPAVTGESNGPPYSSASDPILLRLERLDADYVGLETFIIAQHSGRQNNRGGDSSNATDKLNSLSTLSTSSSGNAADGSAAITAGTADQSGSTAEASVTPSYTAGATKVITIGAKGEVRAKRLARQTLNRLRK